MRDKIFCDSNIFLYAFTKQSEIKHKIASRLVIMDCIISTQVINEVSNNLIKKFKFDEEMVRRFVESCYRRYEIVDFSKDTFLIASKVRESYNISYYDSLIVASALGFECDILYSEDMQDGLDIKELKIINPF